DSRSQGFLLVSLANLLDRLDQLLLHPVIPDRIDRGVSLRHRLSPLLKMGIDRADDLLLTLFIGKGLGSEIHAGRILFHLLFIASGHSPRKFSLPLEGD